MTLPGTLLSTFAWHQTCVSGKFFFLYWEKPRGRAEVSAGVSFGLNTRVFDKSNVRPCQKNPPALCKGRVGAVRDVRGDVDLLVVVTYMWPEPCCVTDRERKRRHVISKAPGRLADVSAEGMRPVSSDAIGPRCPQRENFDGGQLRFLLEKHFMLAINSDERFSCGPTYFGPPPLCSRTRVFYISAPQAIQLQVRDARVFRLWGSKLQLVAAPGHRDHLPPGMELDIALLFRQVLVAPVPRWDKEKLVGLVLRSQGPWGCSKRAGGSCVGFKFASTTPYRGGKLESTGGCYSSCRTAFSAGTTQTSGKTRGHGCCSLTHASGPPSCSTLISGSCGY